MKVLIWLRALKAFNFFNWNKQLLTDEFSLIIDDLSNHPEFNLGRIMIITSVNRTTGRITCKWN